jgi:hypothetical protein
MAAAGAATEAAVGGAVAVVAVVVIAVTAAIAGKWTSFKSLAFFSRQKSQTVLPAMVIKYLCPELPGFNWSRLRRTADDQALSCSPWCQPGHNNIL